MSPVVLTLLSAAIPLILLEGAQSGERLEEIQWLREEIERHDALYFKEGSPEISDEQYDQLRSNLQELEMAWPEAAREAGPNLAPFGDDRLNKEDGRVHRVPMLSLRKSYSEEDLREFHVNLVESLGQGEISYRLEPKIDGVAISAVYQNGQLEHILTRGNGLKGEDITEQIRQTGDLPQFLGEGAPDYLELRGEAYLPWETFEALNRKRIESGEDPFADPRSVAAGSVRLRDMGELNDRGLKVVIFAWGAWETASSLPESGAAFNELLQAWAVPSLPNSIAVQGIEDLLDGLRAMESQRGNWPFPSDGIVVKAEWTADRKRMGIDSVGPRWAIACKFEPASGATLLHGITWQVGATGVLTPVAQLEPLQLAGRTVRRANLFNASYLLENDYRVGDRVRVELKGGVIPLLSGVEKEYRRDGVMPPLIPAHCPSCLGLLTHEGTGSRLKCLNPVCRQPSRPE